MSVRIGERLTFDDVVAVAHGAEVEIADGLADDMAPARSLVEEAVASGATVYGISTGIGDLANVRIAAEESAHLQRNIVRSHATAVGPPLPSEVVRGIMLLKARTFAFGISGVRFEVVRQISRFLNERIHPVIPAQGSLGASGDLSLLAHMALPLMGEGDVESGGAIEPAGNALRAKGIEPLELSYKEGLSLVNGTEPMLALGILTLARMQQLARAADIAGAMSVEALFGTDRVFAPELIGLRKHEGSVAVAENLRRLLDGSEIVLSHRHSDHIVQDAYSLRCMPQVHGAYRDGMAYVASVLGNELDSAVDNPSVIVGSSEVMSSGNFHGEALALALDHLGLCATGFGTISERRTARLMDPHLSNGLPAFLTSDPGRRSGFMLAQYTAASLVSENKGLCHPASADSIPSSAGQEDHVSMGMTSARRASEITSNCERVIAIELLASAQGLDLRAPLQPAAGTGAARSAIRAGSPHLDEDRPLSGDIEKTAAAIENGELLVAVTDAIGPLT